jgi:hypothetical protein
VRADLALLFQVGGFDAVEAWVEPWPSVDEAGEPFEAVHVVYRVYAPPTVGKVRIEGVKGPARRIVEGAHGLDRGEPYHLEELVLGRLTTALRAGRDGRRPRCRSRARPATSWCATSRSRSRRNAPSASSR